MSKARKNWGLRLLTWNDLAATVTARSIQNYGLKTFGPKAWAIASQCLSYYYFLLQQVCFHLSFRPVFYLQNASVGE